MLRYSNFKEKGNFIKKFNKGLENAQVIQSKNNNIERAKNWEFGLKVKRNVISTS